MVINHLLTGMILQVGVLGETEVSALENLGVWKTGKKVWSTQKKSL